MAAQRTAPAESWLSSLFTWELLWLAWAPTSPTKGWNPRQNFLPFILTVAYTPSAPVEWFAVSKQLAGCWNMNWKAELWFSIHPGNVMQCHPRPLRGGPWPVSHTCLWGGHVSYCVRKGTQCMPSLTVGGGLIKLLSGIRCRAVVTGSWEGWREGWWRPPTGYKATVRQRKSQHSTVE